MNKAKKIGCMFLEIALIILTMKGLETEILHVVVKLEGVIKMIQGHKYSYTHIVYIVIYVKMH